MPAAVILMARACCFNMCCEFKCFVNLYLFLDLEPSFRKISGSELKLFRFLIDTNVNRLVFEKNAENRHAGVGQSGSPAVCDTAVRKDIRVQKPFGVTPVGMKIPAPAHLLFCRSFINPVSAFSYYVRRGDN